MTHSTRKWLLYFTVIEAIVLVGVTAWQNLYLINARYRFSTLHSLSHSAADSGMKPSAFSKDTPSREVTPAALPHPFSLNLGAESISCLPAGPPRGIVIEAVGNKPKQLQHANTHTN